jgi:dTDP-4-dehydrorhamnose 3,5-epimerase
MRIKETNLKGLVLIEPNVYEDERGFFLETYQESRYKKAGIVDKFIQDNHSRSNKGVLRGMHFQIKNPQAQILTVMRGAIFDVCVDIRKESKTFGQWFGVELSEFGTRQIYMEAGFAHGYCVLSEEVDLHYKVSSEYDPSDQNGLIWNDPQVGIAWPSGSYIVSGKDQSFKSINDAIK